MQPAVSQPCLSTMPARLPGRWPGPLPGAAVGAWPERALALGLAGLVLALFGRRFLELAQTWLDDDTYSHGFLVPLVSAFFAWRWVQSQGWPVSGELRRGLLWAFTGCALHLAAVVIWLPPLDFLALIAILHGLAVARGGPAWARGLRFSLWFLFFMFPLPAALTNQAAVALQGIVAGLATQALQFFVPVSRQGNWILMPGQQLEVGESCSGLRQIVAFAALTLMIVHVSKRSWIFKSAILASGLPVAIGANVLRVLLMAFILRHFGSPWISGAWHSTWGVVTMIAGLGMLVGIGCWLGRLLGSSEGSDLGAAPRRESDTRGRSATAGRLAVVAGCLAVTLGGQAALQAYLEAGKPAEAPGLTRPLEQFPCALPDWHGRELALDQANTSLREYAGAADDWLYRTYTFEVVAEGGLSAELWMVHYRDGQDRNHHPLLCYTAAGYEEVAAGRATLHPAARPSGIERYCFRRGKAQTHVFYWHYTLEPPADEEASLLRRIYQRQRQRLPSLTLEVFTGARTESELAQVAQLVEEVDRQIQAHLPPGARMGCETLPIRFVGAR